MSTQSAHSRLPDRAHRYTHRVTMTHTVTNQTSSSAFCQGSASTEQQMASSASISQFRIGK
eukprot:9228604-Alexandrium_andersonii.AAC.1